LYEDLAEAVDEADRAPAVAEPIVEAPQELEIAIAGVTPATLAPTVEAPVTEAVTFERHAEDLPIALAGAALAVSVFLPWYRYPVGTTAVTANGWQTGTWGPVVFFLGVGAVVLVALRRLKIAVSLPFPESVVLEGIGWLATLTSIVKARFRPEYQAGLKFGLGNWVWLAVGAGLAIALLAARSSGKAPFVAIPGWWRGRAGTVGAAVLVAIVAASAAFAATNSYKAKPLAGTPQAQQSSNAVRGQIPDCAKSVPFPRTFRPVSGASQSDSCVALLATDQKPTDATAAIKASLTAGHWRFTATPGVSGSTILALTSPKCGTLQIVGVAEGSAGAEFGNTVASLILRPCPQGSNSP